ncbi:MAG: Gfo/Idh/MocA family protein, partial [Tepidisphaeraceae bacterium]
MSESRLRFGVVGLGRAGWDIHVSALRDRADVKVVAVADPVPERRKQAAEDLGAEAYDSLNALLKDDRIEVVVIATPSSAHAPDTLAALKAGKHVLVEKPMGVSLA